MSDNINENLILYFDNQEIDNIDLSKTVDLLNTNNIKFRTFKRNEYYNSLEPEMYNIDFSFLQYEKDGVKTWQNKYTTDIGFIFGQTSIRIFEEYFDTFNNYSKLKELPIFYWDQEFDINDNNHTNVLTKTSSYSFNISNIDGFKQNKTYLVKIDNIKFDGYTQLFNFEYSIRFESSKLIDNFTTLPKLNSFVNDSFYKMNNMDKMLSLKYILLDAQKELDFEYYPIEITKEKNTRVLLDDDLNPILARFPVSNVLEEKYVNQYLWEYKNYFKDISNPANRSKWAVIKGYQDVQTLKYILTQNATLINQYKGNEKGMEFVFGMFAESLGYQLVSIDENIYKPFHYSITTNLDRTYWVYDIKPIIHPAGWGIDYVYIDEDPSKPYVGRKDFSNMFLNFIILFMQDLSYITAFNMISTNHTSNKHLSLVPVIDVNSEKTFRFRNSDYSYDVNTKLSKEKSFADKTNMSVDITRSFYKKGDIIYLLDDDTITPFSIEENLFNDNWKLRNINTNKVKYIKNNEIGRSNKNSSIGFVKITITTKLEGIATKYRWRVLKKGLIINEFETSLPTFIYHTTSFFDSSNFEVQLIFERGGDYRHWDSEMEYNVNDIVSYRNYIWLCKVKNTNNSPVDEDETFWILLKKQTTWQRFVDSVNISKILKTLEKQPHRVSFLTSSMSERFNKTSIDVKNAYTIDTFASHHYFKENISFQDYDYLPLYNLTDDILNEFMTSYSIVRNKSSYTVSIKDGIIRKYAWKIEINNNKFITITSLNSITLSTTKKVLPKNIRIYPIFLFPDGTSITLTETGPIQEEYLANEYYAIEDGIIEYSFRIQ